MGDRSGYQWQDVPENNFIDTLTYKKLRHVKVLPSPLCTDEDFVRRIYLDITGMLPSAEDVRAFLADNRDQRTKREALIDRLVGNPEYVEQWTNKWCRPVAGEPQVPRRTRGGRTAELGPPGRGREPAL